MTSKLQATLSEQQSNGTVQGRSRTPVMPGGGQQPLGFLRSASQTRRPRLPGAGSAKPPRVGCVKNSERVTCSICECRYSPSQNLNWKKEHRCLPDLHARLVDTELLNRRHRMEIAMLKHEASTAKDQGVKRDAELQIVKEQYKLARTELEGLRGYVLESMAEFQKVRCNIEAHLKPAN